MNRTFALIGLLAASSLAAQQPPPPPAVAKFTVAGIPVILKPITANEVIAIPAVTPHFCVRELMATSPLPVFNIFEPLVQELAARKARRVAVFGTRFVMESALFGEVNEVEMVKPQPPEMDYIHDTYVELARTGAASQEQHRNLTALAHTLLNRDELDAIILAGTDLALLFNDTHTDFPCIDCAALHLKRS